MLPRGLVRVEDDRAQPGGTEVLELVVLQRDQRRDHDRRSLAQQPGELVDGGLPASGRQDREHVAALDCGGGCLELAGPELAEPEARPRQVADRVLDSYRSASSVPPGRRRGTAAQQ